MKFIHTYLAEGKVKQISKDPAMARSLIQQAEARLYDLEHLPLTSENASFRFEGGYECVREAVQAFMAYDGLKPYSHEAVISFARERGLLSESETAAFDRFRKIRNDINYEGEKTTVEETKEIIRFAHITFKTLKIKFNESCIRIAVKNGV